MKRKLRCWMAPDDEEGYARRDDRRGGRSAGGGAQPAATNAAVGSLGTYLPGWSQWSLPPHNEGGALMDDGYEYPTEEQLQKIRAWKHDDWPAMMEFIKGIWWVPDFGWNRDEAGKYCLSTGGWSGNEDLIGAMMGNRIFWLTCWESSRRGGHYVFEVRA